MKIFARMLAALWAAICCGGCTGPGAPGEAERVAADPAFMAAIAMNEVFLLDGSAFCVVRCETSALYPSAAGMRGVYVYIDYPAGQIYPSSALTATDIDGAVYAPSMPDGLDFLGEYRGEAPGGLGYARFVLPRSYDHFLLTLHGRAEERRVRLVVRALGENTEESE